MEEELLEHCEERYGFKWTKHVTSNSFRHMHITYLQNSNSGVALKEIMDRVGHVNVETTMGYTHKTVDSQRESVSALNKFAESNHFNFKILKIGNVNILNQSMMRLNGIILKNLSALHSRSLET